MECLTKINGLESSSTCRTLGSTNVEPPRMLTSTVPTSIMVQFCEFQLGLSWSVELNIAEIVISKGSQDNTQLSPRPMCSIELFI